MKRMALTLALLTGFALGGMAISTAVDAQEDKPRGRVLRGPTETRDTTGQIVRDGKPLTPEQAKAAGMAEAPGVLQRAGIACAITDAVATGGGTAQVDGKPVKVNTYEVACSDGPGLLLQDMGETARSFDCIQAAQSAAPAAQEAPAARGQPAAVTPTCQLPGNASLTTSFQPVIAASGARCTVANVSFLGYSPSAQLRRYEVSCSEGLGFVVDRPATGPVKATDCLTADAGGYDCVLTPKAARTAYIAALAAKANRPCTVSDGRFMGASARGAQFYEVACGASQGYVLEINNGAVTRAFDCLEAAGIGGGCTLVNTTAAMEAREGQYLQALRAKGVSCSGTEFRLLGKDSRQRDVVEFVCADRPAGLVAYIPAAGSTASDIISFDCFEAEGRGLKCQVNPRENLLARLNASMAGKGCNVVNYAVLGASATDGLVVELACQGSNTGYIIDLPENRGAPTKALTCAVSASRGGDRCTLPENRG